MDRLPITQKIRLTVTKYRSEEDHRNDRAYEQLVSNHTIPVEKRGA